MTAVLLDRTVRATMVSGIRRRYLALFVILGLVTVCTPAAVFISSGTSGEPHANRNGTERAILKIALRAAAGAGDPRPALIQYSVGTQEQANLVSSDDIGGPQRSYLIAERGHFVLRDVGIGNQTIRGSVITLVCNAKTLHCTDFGLQGNYPNLAALGPVTTDLGSATAGASKRSGSVDYPLPPGP